MNLSIREFICNLKINKAEFYGTHTISFKAHALKVLPINAIIPAKVAICRQRREETAELLGYIHVSPIKLSGNNNKYFNALFQDHEKYGDPVCSVPEYNKIVNMQKSK